MPKLLLPATTAILVKLADLHRRAAGPGPDGDTGSHCRDDTPISEQPGTD